MELTDRIYVAGHTGMVGSAITRLLKNRGFHQLITRSRKELDLLDTIAVQKFFQKEKPEIVILAAARVGGIKDNMEHPYEYLYENLTIQNNIIYQSYLNGVKQFCFLASSCIYPRECPQPMKEEFLLTGPLEPTNEGYALAKIAGLKLTVYLKEQRQFPGITLIPCNLYGENDSFDPDRSHVLGALVKRFVDAVENNSPIVTLWGTGKARREFMYVDDVAAATLFFLEKDENIPPINVGSGKDISIKELATLIAQKTGYSGKIDWDPSKPDGMPQKILDISRLSSFGFETKVSLDKGIKKMIQFYNQSKAEATTT